MLGSELDLINRLRIRSQIRRNISSRKSVQEDKPDRISDLLEESADVISKLYNQLQKELNEKSRD